MNLHQAETFAKDWIASWNSHNIDAILAHYSDDFEMSSPVIVEAMGEPSGKLKGKVAVRKYWTKALRKYPQLHFEKRHVLAGMGSVTLIYYGVRGLSAEVFHFNQAGKVHTAYAHYIL